MPFRYLIRKQKQQGEKMDNSQELKAHLQDSNKARMYEEKKKKDKLKTILAICESNKKVDWVNAPTQVISDILDEFDYITKLLKEVIDEQ